MNKMVVLAALLVALPSVARADNDAVAEEHARVAKANVVAGHLEEAIVEFDLAFHANPLPKYLFNKAVLERRKADANAGRVEDMRRSRDDFSRYLSLQPNAPDRRQVEAIIDGLRARIESAEAAARDTSVRPPVEPAPPVAARIGEDPKSDPSGERAQPLVFPATEKEKPVPRKRTGVWVAVGVVVGVAAIGLGVGLGVGLSHGDHPPTSMLGDQRVHF